MRRFHSPVSASVTASAWLSRWRRRLSRKARPTRTAASRRVASASARAGVLTDVSPWSTNSSTTAAVAPNAGAASARQPSSRAGRTGRGGESVAAEDQDRGEWPERFEPAVFDVGVGGDLVQVDGVRGDLHEQAQREQAPHQAGAPAGEPDRRDDEQQQQEVADGVGEVRGDDRQAAARRAEHGVEHEACRDRAHPEPRDHAVEPHRRRDPLGAPARSAARCPCRAGGRRGGRARRRPTASAVPDPL